MAYQRVAPIYENEAIKTVALQLIDEIKTEAPELLENWLTITLFQVIENPVVRDYSELSEKMAFYKSLSRGAVYNATIYTNDTGEIKTAPTEGFTFSQNVYYYVVNASVPNLYNFSCVWLNIVPGNCLVGNYYVSVPGIRYYQQVYNTSSSNNIIINNEAVSLEENQAVLYDPKERFAINVVDSNSLNIGLVCDNLEKSLAECISAKPWQIIT